ncbi:MAG: helix-turn-helix domain-containing protein [Lachnospiraceae bacterium]|nr:helix-turn-helix domain-containing protein [Lachnospiraceae bacterium]
MEILEYALSSDKREEILKYCDRRLYKLEEYEHVIGTPLMDTLLTYYKSGFSTVKAAEALGIHRNSFRYRMQKIWELLELEPEDYMAYLELVNCMLIRRRMHGA